MAEAPNINSILAIQLPKIFPSASSELPEKLANKFTISSGKDVPNDTIVRPITISEILNRLPIEDAPSTRKSAPLIRITKPTTKRK